MRLPNNRRAWNNAVSFACESLESRRHFSIGASITGSVVNIYCSSFADTVVVGKSGTSLTVTVNSRVFNFNEKWVNKIAANLLGGSDKFTSDSSILIPMTIKGGEGNDTIITGGRADTVYGDAGDDRITGNGDNDYLSADEGNDIVNGNSGNDTLSDGEGKDSLFGGSGNDRLVAESKSVSADLYDGGDGTDEMDYSNNNGGVVITNDGIANDGKAPSSGYNSSEKDNVLPNIENFTGSFYGSDRIKITGNGNNRIFAQDGADFVDAGPGNDTINGGYKNDTLLGGKGNDSISGYYGNDSITGDDGDDILSGEENGDTIKGGNGQDKISGGGGDDSLYGEAGSDTLVGDSGFDRFFGGTGADMLNTRDNVYSEIVDGGGGGDIAYIDYLVIVGNRTPLDVLINVATWL